MIERAPFGSTGHQSSRVIFGAAALMRLDQAGADRVFEQLLAHGVNHIDTAADYGESELRIAPWMQRHRGEFFLATKTIERGGPEARASLERSLERLGVDRVDLIQLHHLVGEEGFLRAHAPGGAVEALARAREEGLVRFLGVTGHGFAAAEMHRRSLERFPFDSVLLPCNYSMLAQRAYATDFERLLAVCRRRGVAVQTIKSVARRRWKEPPSDRRSWYEPLPAGEALRRGVHFVLSREGLFLNSSSDTRLLPEILAAAQEDVAPPELAALERDVARQGIEPLFTPGVNDI